jgi:hypothetical protein
MIHTTPMDIEEIYKSSYLTVITILPVLVMLNTPSLITPTHAVQHRNFNPPDSPNIRRYTLKRNVAALTVMASTYLMIRRMIGMRIGDMIWVSPSNFEPDDNIVFTIACRDEAEENGSLPRYIAESGLPILLNCSLCLLSYFQNTPQMKKLRFLMLENPRRVWHAWSAAAFLVLFGVHCTLYRFMHVRFRILSSTSTNDIMSFGQIMAALVWVPVIVDCIYTIIGKITLGFQYLILCTNP